MERLVSKVREESYKLDRRGGALNRMREAKAAGYDIHVFFLGLDRVETIIERVEVRVKNGGHYIPDETIRTRYVTSAQHLIEHLDLIDELFVIDNSTTESRTILIAEKGVIVSASDDLPLWAKKHKRSSTG